MYKNEVWLVFMKLTTETNVGLSSKIIWFFLENGLNQILLFQLDNVDDKKHTLLWNRKFSC